MLLHIVLMDVDCLGVYHKSDRYTLEGGRPIVERLLFVGWARRVCLFKYELFEDDFQRPTPTATR